MVGLSQTPAEALWQRAYSNSDDRSDIVVLRLILVATLSWLSLLLISLGCWHHCHSSHRRRSSKDRKKRKRPNTRKSAIYFKLHSFSFIPFWTKALGGTDLFLQLSLKSVNEDGRKKWEQFQSLWRRWFSVAVERWNVRLIELKCQDLRCQSQQQRLLLF